MAYDPLSGPIPGANYTSDTKNYPWHRPPQFNTRDECLEFFMRSVSDIDVSTSLLTMLESGVTVAELTDMLITAGIGGGRWSIDMGLMIAGPVAHIIIILARGYDDLEFEVGIKKRAGPSKAFFDQLDMDKIAENTLNMLDDSGEAQTAEAPPSEQGFMGGPPSAQTLPAPVGPAEQVAAPEEGI